MGLNGDIVTDPLNIVFFITLVIMGYSCTVSPHQIKYACIFILDAIFNAAKGSKIFSKFSLVHCL